MQIGTDYEATTEIHTARLAPDEHLCRVSCVSFHDHHGSHHCRADLMSIGNVEPKWIKRTPKDYPIGKIPPSEQFVMRHAHLIASTRMAFQFGVQKRWPQENKVILKLSYTDIKQLNNFETIEKEYKCFDCGEMETYRFHMRRPGENPEIHIVDGKQVAAQQARRMLNARNRQQRRHDKSN
jgi:hypothetical protein